MVFAREISLGSVREAEWDGFAARCQGSMRVARAHLAAWALKNLLRYRLRLFELYANADGRQEKIGQCAVGVSTRRPSVFLDCLQLVPGDERWAQAMSALLTRLGPGEFEYGWELNLEPPRDGDLTQIDGVTIEESTPLVVHAIDFSRWETWDDYHRGMRKGARQSAQFAFRDIPDLHFKLWTGHNSVRAAPTLLRFRSDLSRRKGLGLKIAGLMASYFGWMLLTPKYTVTSLAVGNGRNLAAYYGADFGDTTYYLEAASVPGNQGSSWAVLISMIRRAYERNKLGRFIMGYVNYATHDEEVSGGLLRSRTACRVSEYPTSVVRFRYAG